MRPVELGETMEGTTLQWMRTLSYNNNIILTGSLIIKESDQYFNRLVWMLPNGQYGYYDKRHLFAYAEEHKYFAAGNKRLIASVKGWKINMQVCYDLRFPVWARNRILPSVNSAEAKSALPGEMNEGFDAEYDILINVANWPARRSHAWKTLLCARAIENQSYVIGVNRVGRDGNNIDYTGNTLVIDPLGEVLYHMEQEEDVFTITLEKEHLNSVRTKFPFWKDADNFILR
jgi:predicted amidohydrolase